MQKKDELKLFFGDNYQISDTLSIRQPRIGDIVEMGEHDYFSLLAALTAIPSDMKSLLWKAGIDWMELSDVQLFFMITRELSKEKTAVFFGDLDFSEFVPEPSPLGEFSMRNSRQGVTIDANVHRLILDFLCRSHNIKKKVEKAGNELTKQILIREEEERLARQQNVEEAKSTLIPILSSMVNSSGFKYSLSEVRELTVYQLMDSFHRIQKQEVAKNLAIGYYTGNMDAKKFNTDKLFWMGDL